MHDQVFLTTTDSDDWLQLTAAEKTMRKRKRRSEINFDVTRASPITASRKTPQRTATPEAISPNVVTPEQTASPKNTPRKTASPKTTPQKNASPNTTPQKTASPNRRSSRNVSRVLTESYDRIYRKSNSKESAATAREPSPIRAAMDSDNNENISTERKTAPVSRRRSGQGAANLRPGRSVGGVSVSDGARDESIGN